MVLATEWLWRQSGARVRTQNEANAGDLASSRRWTLAAALRLNIPLEAT
jgi:hypothetical protein